MRLRYDPWLKHWVGVQSDGDRQWCIVDKSVWRPLWFAITGRNLRRRPPTWTFRVDCFSGDGLDQYAECSAGMFSRWLYFEIVQGRDFATGVFYRWLRIGIPRHGCWRIRLQKRWPV